MFLSKYLDDFSFEEVLDNYNFEFICQLDEENFVNIYNLLKKYNFYFINDIIVNYLEIFTLNYEIVEQGILSLKEKLGDKFVYIIGNDMRYLNELLD